MFKRSQIISWFPNSNRSHFIFHIHGNPKCTRIWFRNWQFLQTVTTLFVIYYFLSCSYDMFYNVFHYYKYDMVWICLSLGMFAILNHHHYSNHEAKTDSISIWKFFKLSFANAWKICFAKIMKVEYVSFHTHF